MKYISYIRYALIAISAVLVILGLTSSDAASGVDMMLRWGEGTFIVAIVAVILLSVYNLAKNPKSAGRSLIGILCVVVVGGIAYAMSDGTSITTAATVYDNAAVLKFSDTGLFTTYIVFGLAVISIVATEIYNTIRK